MKITPLRKTVRNSSVAQLQSLIAQIEKFKGFQFVHIQGRTETPFILKEVRLILDARTANRSSLSVCQFFQKNGYAIELVAYKHRVSHDIHSMPFVFEYDFVEPDPVIELRGYTGIFDAANNIWKFGCALIAPSHIQAAYDFITNQYKNIPGVNRQIRCVTIGDGNFGLDILTKMVTHQNKKRKQYQDSRVSDKKKPNRKPTARKIKR